MRYICFIAVLFWFNTTNAKGYISYHQEIIKAENHIQTGEYNTALILYNKTFNEYPHAFYKDLHNACVCACKTGQLKKATQFAEKLVLQGYVITDFNNSGFTPLRNDKKLWQKFEKKYALLRQQYDKSLNHKLRKKYYNLFVTDQKAAKPGNSLYSQDSAFYHQAIELSKLFQKHGFPVLDANKDTLDIKIFVQLRHYFGLVNRFSRSEEMQKDSIYSEMEFEVMKLDEILLGALHNGKLLPQTYADIISYMDNSVPYGELMLKIDYNTEKVFISMDLDEERLKDVNKKRLSIGLRPVDYNANISLLYTWYNSYPFKEIKQAYLDCDECRTRADYLDIQDLIIKKFKNSFTNNEKDQFIIKDKEIKKAQVFGIEKYEKNIRKSNR